ncbi:MAG TPA: NAD-glutamate dehydrogenase [Thermoanaerobaculia bacterium]|nr:NAD-glutamate dehydrogenase [Thermoanaerobaculia bacterium]
MVPRSEQLKAQRIDDLARRARDEAPPELRDAAERAVRQLYAHVPAEDLLADRPEDLWAAAIGLWRFAQERPTAAPKVRVYHPRLEEHGWESPHSVVEIVNDDMPFLVDSVTAELARREAEVHLVIHPVLRVERDAAGRVVAVHDPDAPPEGARAESVMHVRITAQPAERQEQIRAALELVLADVRAAIEDWRAMRERCRGLIAELERRPPPLPADEIEEGLAFLQWMDDHHFTYLGYREYAFEGEGESAIARVLPASGLGLLRDEQTTVFHGLRSLGTLPPDVRQFLRQPELLSITKANRLSTVHRAVHMDAIAIKCFDPQGHVTGMRLFAGLFTAAAYSSSTRSIPFLRQKVEKVLTRADFAPGSHDAKSMRHILEVYPRDQLFQIGDEDLFRIAMGYLNLQQRQRIALFVRRDPFERFVSAQVLVPRDRFDSELRPKFQEILEEAYRGRVGAVETYLTEDAFARLHFIVDTTPGAIPEVDTDALEERLIETGRSWTDRLMRELVGARGEEEGVVLAQRWGKAFPPSYQERFAVAAALEDIAYLERALAAGFTMSLYRPAGAAPHELRLKIYTCGPSVPLSDLLPMLEAMGLRVNDEVPFAIRLAGAEDCGLWIRDLELVSEDRTPVPLEAVRDAFHEAFTQVWFGTIEGDGFNKLVLRAGLVAREVNVLRAYCKYLRQARIPFSQFYMQQTLAKNPEVARLLVELFGVRFDPARRQGAEARAREIVAEIERLLDAVGNLDEDRILRRYLNVVEATLRTNHFQKAADGGPKAYLSFKLDSRQVEELPVPRPYREIFVYSPRLEAAHLRGGKVARGGIRWSDRREDFRTEVLGLMKAQMVKNAVIVPVGSKGGFVVKRPPAADPAAPAAAAREKLMAEVVDCYRTMMRGLLDLTDNLRGGEVLPPPDVVRRDDDDPYLVVAADKGTATFSDLANSISAEYGFWLDDAFASGGSAGYDHKGMAITSRGVWESVKRHFRELGKDVEREDFTVVGVGDMSGDVFGNGMLRSRHIKLLAAFDHRHVFVDPDPDPEASFAERQRLFALPRSSWADYDPKLVSPGGGVFERGLKAVPVSPEMRALFTLPAEEVTPAELMQAILRADVELLWFGGIGTYVKARLESHADVGDRANDALRVDGADLRVKVVGEGANLGMTQLGRIEYALASGGRLNADWIDNSAGVDCSDHEVNIKILLGDIERAGGMTRPERDQLLRAMTDEVAALVLRDNYLQTQALTVTHQLGARLLDRLGRFMRALEKGGRLDRRIEYLPDDETLAARATQGIGLTRPELAVLLSYAKIALYDELLPSTLPDDPYLQEDLELYFPTPLRSRFAAEIGRHRLRREIIATAVTNSMVNRVGVAFVYEVRERTGLGAPDVGRAYVVAREVFEMRAFWRDVEALDNQAPAAVQATMLAECGRAVERGATWFLRVAGAGLDIGGLIADYGPKVRELVQALEGLLPESDRKPLRERAAELTAPGVPEELAWRVAALGYLAPILDIVRLASGAGLGVAQVARTYFSVGERFGFDWLRRAAAGLPTDNAWNKLAVSAIVDDLYGHQSALTGRVLAEMRNGAPPERLLEIWTERRRPQVARTEQLLAELQSISAPDLAMLAVANQQLKSLGG